MNIYRTVIHGHVIEARRSEWASESILLDGRIVSRKPWAGLLRTSHHFDITDERGESRHVEVRWIDISKLGLGKYRVLVIVDGMERCRLEPVDLSKPPDACANCGYALKGLPVQNGEVRCPECGRHSMAAFMQSPGAKSAVD